jgi:hypothetical protein
LAATPLEAFTPAAAELLHDALVHLSPMLRALDAIRDERAQLFDQLRGLLLSSGALGRMLCKLEIKGRSPRCKHVGGQLPGSRIGT